MISSLLHFRRSAPVYCIVPALDCQVSEECQPENVLRLPSYVLFDRIFPFLHLAEMVRLDVALNNRKLRHDFHEALNGFEVTELVNFLHIDWFAKRKCSVRNLAVTSQFPMMLTASVLPILETVHSVQIFCGAEFCSRTMQLLFMACNHLLTLDLQYFEGVTKAEFYCFNSTLTLQHINASNNRHITDVELVSLIARCPDLRTLRVEYCGRVTLLTTHHLAMHCPQLRELQCDWFASKNQGGFYDEVFVRCRHFSHVTVYDTRSAHKLTSVAAHLTQLTHLRVRVTSSFDDEDVQPNDDEVALQLRPVQDALLEVMMQNPSIVALDMSRVELTPATLYAIAQYLPNLHELTLMYSVALADAIVNVRDKCVHLTYFELTTSYTMQSTHPILKHGPAGKLTTLVINNNSILDSAVESIAMHNYNLRTLTIRGGYAFETALQTQSSNWSAMFPHLHYLTEFSMSRSYSEDLPGSYDCVLLALSQHCRNLTLIDVSYHRGMTDVGFIALSTLTQLQHINAHSCCIGDSSIVAIARSCTNLNHIDIGESNVSGVGVYILAQHCRKLRVVQLSHIRRLRNYAVRALIRNNPQLRSLNLYDNWMLTFGAVSLLPVYCPYMNDLYFNYCMWGMHPLYRKHKLYFKRLWLRHNIVVV